MIQSSMLSLVALILVGTSSWSGSQGWQMRFLSTHSSGQLKGRIEAVNGGVVPDAKVVVEGEGTRREVVTDGAGGFETQIPTGTYRIQVDRIGFCPGRRAAFRMQSNATITFDFTLFPCSLANVGRVNSSRQEHRYIEPFEYEVFQVNDKSNSSPEVMIRFGRRNEQRRVIEYRGGAVNYDERNDDQVAITRREKDLPVMVSYDIYTIHADVVRIHTKTLKIEAVGNVTIDDGHERIHAIELKFDPLATNPIIEVVKN